MASLKRKDYLNWDEYFMGIAKLTAGRSKASYTALLHAFHHIPSVFQAQDGPCWHRRYPLKSRL